MQRRRTKKRRATDSATSSRFKRVRLLARSPQLDEDPPQVSAGLVEEDEFALEPGLLLPRVSGERLVSSHTLRGRRNSPGASALVTSRAASAAASAAAGLPSSSSSSSGDVLSAEVDDTRASSPSSFLAVLHENRVEARVTPRAPSPPSRLPRARLEQTRRLDEEGDEEDSAPEDPEFVRGAGETFPRWSRAYDLVEVGRGNFSVVWRARSRRSGRLYALKQATHKLRSSVLRDTQKQAMWVRQVGPHPALLRVFRVWQEGGELWWKTEYCEYGALSDLLPAGQVPEPLVLALLGHISSGLAALHARGLVHLDVKPDNVFINRQWQPKLGDFGRLAAVSAWNDEEGDSRYLAPEVLDDMVCTASDMFSLGLMLFSMCGLGELPSQGPLFRQLREIGKAQEEDLPSCASLDSIESIESLDGSPQMLQAQEEEEARQVIHESMQAMRKVYSIELCTLVFDMISASPEARPQALSVVQHPEVAAAMASGAVRQFLEGKVRCCG